MTIFGCLTLGSSCLRRSESGLSKVSQYFGVTLKAAKSRQDSYDFLRTFVADNHDWSGKAAPNSDVIVPKLRAKLSKLSKEEFAFLLCHSGFIPEEYEHDSSEETIYTKLVEALVQEWAIRIGFLETDLPKQKSSKEDITIKDDTSIIVCDAKSFRLGRSQKAPNVKDALKEGDIAKWLDAYKTGKHSALGGLVTFPSQHDWSGGSDFYLYLTKKELPIVCLFYEHLAFMLVADIGKSQFVNLYRQYGALFPSQLKKRDGNRSQYWQKVFAYLFSGHKEWPEFASVAQDVIKEKVYHTIRGVETHLHDIRKAIAQDIPANATAIQLREMLVDARFKLETFAVDRQLLCIKSFRDHATTYLPDE